MSVPLSLARPQLNLRLLELPPDLLSLFESPNSPTLHLKSHDNPANAVLCTSDKTFEVRQVMSSNVTYVLQQNSADKGVDGYTAIAQCGGVLELIPGKGDVVEWLRETLPVYEPEGMGTVTRRRLYEDAPFSDQELQNAMKELCIFEKDNHLWIPPGYSLIATWKSLLTAATINGVDLDRPWTREELQAQIREDGIDLGVYSALIARLSKDTSEVRLDSATTTSWVGQILLESQVNPISKNEFMDMWQDLLPERWRNHADLAALQCVSSADGLISSKSQSAPVPSAAAPKVQSKSKWHEKFKK